MALNYWCVPCSACCCLQGLRQASLRLPVLEQVPPAGQPGPWTKGLCVAVCVRLLANSLGSAARLRPCQPGRWQCRWGCRRNGRRAHHAGACGSRQAERSGRQAAAHAQRRHQRGQRQLQAAALGIAQQACCDVCAMPCEGDLQSCGKPCLTGTGACAGGSATWPAAISGGRTGRS